MSGGPPGLVYWTELLGQALLHLLWQGAVVGLVWLALCRLLPRTGGLRYAAGLAMLAVMALLPGFTLLWLHAHAPSAAGGAAAAAGMGVADVALALGQPLSSYLPWVVAAWFAGVGLGTARVGLLCWRLRRIVLRHSITDARLDGLLEGLGRRFGVVRARLRITDRIDTPMLVGWLCPVILLPAALALGLPRRNLELVLAHELAHLRRLDPLANLFQLLVETLFFYHPVVHWISRDVRHQRELCCDQLVLRRMDEDALTYARTLVRLEEARQPRLVIAASGGELLERVRQLVDPAPTPTAGTARLPVVLMGLALMAALMLMQARTRVLVPEMPAPAWSWMMGEEPWSVPVPHHAAAIPDPVPLASLPPAGEATSTGAPDFSSRAVQVQAAPSPAADVRAGAAASAPPPESAAAVATTPAAVSPASHGPPPPVATRADVPAYRGSPGAGIERVRLGFGISADGRVRDIEVMSGAEHTGFARAAGTALQKWRFDPATLPAVPVRYVQEFVFEPLAGAEDTACSPRTGSRLCRR